MSVHYFFYTNEIREKTYPTIILLSAISNFYFLFITELIDGSTFYPQMGDKNTLKYRKLKSRGTL